MFKNKIFILFLIFITCFTIPVWADDIEEEDISIEDLQALVVESAAQPIKEPNLNARAAIIYDRTSKEMIWGKNETQKRPMASTTKIMTAIVVLEHGNLSDVVTVSQKAAGTGGSRLKINTGDKITVHDLLYGLMLCSRK